MRSDILFWSQKRTKKTLGWRRPQTPAPSAEWGKGVNKKQKTKGFWEILAQNLFFCTFVFCVAWNEKFVKSKSIWVRLHSNSWQTFQFHAISLIRRVKAKNALTLLIYIFPNSFEKPRQCSLFWANGAKNLVNRLSNLMSRQIWLQFYKYKSYLEFANRFPIGWLLNDLH